MPKPLKDVSVEQLMAEAESVLVELAEVDIPAFRERLSKINKRCDGAYNALLEVEDRLAVSKEREK